MSLDLFTNSGVAGSLSCCIVCASGMGNVRKNLKLTNEEENFTLTNRSLSICTYTFVMVKCFWVVPFLQQLNFWTKKPVHVGMEPSKINQTRWKWHYSTFTPSLHLCHFANYAHHKILYMDIVYLDPLNEHGTPHFSLHSLPHRDNQMLPCPAAEFYNITSNIPYRPITAHALHSFRILQDRPYLRYAQ